MRTSILILILASGCGQTARTATIQTPDAAAPVSPPDAGALAPACPAVGSQCGADGCCASGSYCFINGYSREDGICTAQAADGEACFADEQCLAGVCTEGVCGTPVCHAESESCYDNPCCAGLFCDFNRLAYGVGYCRVPRAFGEPCEGHEQCASGQCADNICGDRSEVSFARVFTEVLSAGGCTNGYCHGGGAGGLSMRDPTAAYRALVGIGGACDGTARVSPGDAESSLIWRKVAPSVAVCGSKMPPAGNPLTAAQLELLQAWIMAGAPM